MFLEMAGSQLGRLGLRMFVRATLDRLQRVEGRGVKAGFPLPPGFLAPVGISSRDISYERKTKVQVICLSTPKKPQKEIKKF